MIRLPDIQLHHTAAAKLGTWQAELDAEPAYSERVTKAAALFKSRNRKGNVTFGRVRDALTLMCAGARRCAYCEDSAADEVEHVRPKDLYPEDS